LQIGEIGTIINNYTELYNTFNYYINSKDKTKNIKEFLTPTTIKNINEKFKNIVKKINSILENIKNKDKLTSGQSGNSSNNYNVSYSSTNIKSKFIENFENLSKIRKKFTTNLNQIKESSNQFYEKFKLLKEEKKLPDDFIQNKIEFFKSCKKVYSLIKQKLISQNNYLNKLFVFYKILYTLKKKEYEKVTTSSRQFKNADNIRLQLSIRIILFDVIIYNTLIYDKCYRNVYELYIKNIDISIKKLEELEIKRFNIKDETTHAKQDHNNEELINLFKDYYYYIFFINFNLDKIMWDIISKKTLDIKNKFKSFISKSINEYAKNISLYEDTNETVISQVKTQMDNLYNLDLQHFFHEVSKISNYYIYLFLFFIYIILLKI
jgi:hypothetical protein